MVADILTVLLCLSSTLSIAAMQQPDVNARTLFEQKCSICHSIERPKSQRKTPEQWKNTVLRMRENGCPITDDEARKIIDYLSNNYAR